MNEAYIFQLKTPCRNRAATLVNNGNGTVSINGNLFETIGDVENYLESLPRVD